MKETELLKNNNVGTLLMVIEGGKNTPDTNKILFTVNLPRWKMKFFIGWELKDCIPLSIPQNRYRFYVVNDYQRFVNSNEEYYCLFVSCG